MLISEYDYNRLNDLIKQLIISRNNYEMMYFKLDSILDNLLEIYDSIIDSKDIEVENNI